MKKLTRKRLEDLALEVPVLNEIEQRDCIGGKIVAIDKEGNIVTASAGMLGLSSTDYNYQTNDADRTYWHVVDNKGKSKASYIQNGNFTSNQPNGAINDMDIEGSSVDRGLLSFVGANTKVEWMYLESTNESGETYGRLITNNNRTEVLFSCTYTGFTTMIHSHPSGSILSLSEADQQITGTLIRLGYSKLMVYDVETNQWITYYGDADERLGEVDIDDTNMTLER